MKATLLSSVLAITLIAPFSSQAALSQINASQAPDDACPTVAQIKAAAIDFAVPDFGNAPALDPSSFLTQFRIKRKDGYVSSVSYHTQDEFIAEVVDQSDRDTLVNFKARSFAGKINQKSDKPVYNSFCVYNSSESENNSDLQLLLGKHQESLEGKELLTATVFVRSPAEPPKE